MSRYVCAAVVGLSVSGASMAGTPATEWRKSEGGNGHWYGCFATAEVMTWYAASELAVGAGGYLATMGSAAENDFALSVSIATTGGWSGSAGPWLGGNQDTDSPQYAEPGGGWRWWNNEPWVYTAWGPGSPNNGCGGWTGESAIHFVDPTCTEIPTAKWEDRYPWGVFCPPCGDEAHAALVEWSADCNGDGLVDIGQILNGELGDWNGNGVPDCCDMPPPPPCPGDFNGDAVVNGADLSILLGYWGGPPQVLPPGMDADCDGVVTGADLAALLGAWGVCP